MTIAPELADRFRADLLALWPELLAEEPPRLGLAVSGGGDSLALLLLANAALPGKIEAATVDHRLRPENAQEARMVARVCSTLGVAHAVLPVRLAPGNLQDRARHARYAALAEWSRQRGLGALATGHQLDDQAETLVMRLNRGSGLAGLAGVRGRGTVPGGTLALLRPLLGWRRQELAEVVAAYGLEAACDASNANDAFDRVRIRKALADAAWLDPVSVGRSARLLGEADAAWRWVIAREFDANVRRYEDELIYHPLGDETCPAVLYAGVVGLAYRALGKDIGSAEAAQLVRRLLQGAKVNVAGIQAQACERDGRPAWVFAPEVPRRKS